jgi:Trypsin-co-occurring domain 1
MSMDDESEVVSVRLPNGVVVGVEVAEGGAGNVSALDQLDFRQVEGVIEGLAQVVTGALRKSRPHRATAELGLNLQVESGKLTGILVKAGGSASLKISLTWERSSAAGGEAPAVDAEEASAEPAAVDGAPDDGEAG